MTNWSPDGIRALGASIDAEKVRRARAMSPAERFVAAANLFDESIHWVRAGVRLKHPDASPEELQRRVRERLDRIRRIREHGNHSTVDKG